jgi:hypothetical protein
MVMLTSISENTIMDNLKKRHANDVIYVCVALVIDVVALINFALSYTTIMWCDALI